MPLPLGFLQSMPNPAAFIAAGLCHISVAPRCAGPAQTLQIGISFCDLVGRGVISASTRPRVSICVGRRIDGGCRRSRSSAPHSEHSKASISSWCRIPGSPTRWTLRFSLPANDQSRGASASGSAARISSCSCPGNGVMRLIDDQKVRWRHLIEPAHQRHDTRDLHGIEGGLGISGGNDLCGTPSAVSASAI